MNKINETKKIHVNFFVISSDQCLNTQDIILNCIRLRIKSVN